VRADDNDLSLVPVLYPGPTVPCTPYLYLDRLASGLLRLWINVCVVKSDI